MPRAARRAGSGRRVLTRAAGCLAGVALAACSAQPAAAPTQPTTTESRPPAGASSTNGTSATPTASAAEVPPRAPGAAAPSASNTPTDVTQQAAGAFVPAATPPAAPAAAVPAAAAAAGVDYADPLAVARGYVTTRLTYRFDDPAGYTAALTAPAFTSTAFATRSTPSAAALNRLATSQETSAVQVAGAELEGEAPNSASTRYVVVTCTVTTTYRGGGDTAPAAWTLRLVQAAPGQWRVDGVLSTD